MQRTINAKAKVGLKSSIMIWNIDFCCHRNHQPSYNTFDKVQTQDLTAKKFKPTKTKPRKLNLANKISSILPCIHKSAKFTYQKKKKKYWKKKQDQKNSILTTENNAIESGKKKKNNRKCCNC